MPLPPYISRKESLAVDLKDFDKNRYQTIYAKEIGAIAAPTAGLHFTQEILEKIEKKGADIICLTLYVGWGTFKPITKSDISKHIMPSETFVIDSANAAKLNKCLAEKRRIFAAGTTSARALESLAQKSGKNIDGVLQIEAFEGQTDIFIHPGYNFQIVKGLLTNFHLPKSTPLMMASAFSTRELLLKAYKEAIEKKYRFFSYGDAMLIL
jgi:S-adenosylmethionine:tRNA ribosyltransferase-isomerase